MSTLPPDRSGGSPAPSNEAFNSLRAYAIANATGGTSLGMRRRTFAGGTIYSPIAQPSFRVNQTRAGPLDLQLVEQDGDTAGTMPYVGKFVPGTINGLIPSNFQALEGVARTGLIYVGLELTLSNATVQSAEFVMASAPFDAFPVVEGVPPTEATILTHVILDGVVYRAVAAGSLWLTPSVTFELEKPGPLSPGERNTVSWFTYVLTTT